ncbi:MAG: hypothetical protein JXE07_00150 [Candidatus Aminicenantes bacterium]|nr:hypothetical protein [Candidatus Aminicenantes bacterium]
MSLEAGEIARRLRLRAGRPGSAQLQDVIELAESKIHLRAVYEISYVGTKNAESVEVGGVVLRSRVLRRNLGRAQKVFPYIMTIGPELEKTAASIGDLLKQYYLEEIANIVLERGVAWLSGWLGERWGFPGLSNLSPGSLEDWPLTEQRPLFSLFGGKEKVIGLALTDRFLILPRKSVSGILFPSEEGFTACRLCPRETCPSRSAPYDESLAAENQ